MAHEMVEPTPALNLAVEEAARPLNDMLAAIVAELLGPAAEPTVTATAWPASSRSVRPIRTAKPSSSGGTK